MHDTNTLQAINAVETASKAKAREGLSTYTALSIVEGLCSSTDEQRIAAWQFLIDTRAAWCLPGYIGRGAQDMVNAGLCTIPGDHADIHV